MKKLRQPNNWLAETPQALAPRRLGRKVGGKGADFRKRVCVMISTPGTRFPRAVREPPRRSPAGSPWPRFSRRSLVPSVPINWKLLFLEIF
ncbi:hypothetical protein [Peribacillus frigoritolerans]|uniref:hypothetical protein n=1 Tax=Peribacillus frigoritolerans TaxID=450367 RepID=UPI0031DFE4F3